jgi:uncharacterized protein (DUF924 family)
METLPNDILDFWFGAPDSALHGTVRDEWFRKDAVFDGQIRARFGETIEVALAGGMTDWTTPRATLARVLLLDQFTRNAFRDSKRAFAGDVAALAVATTAVEQQLDAPLTKLERWFLYLPFEHAESPAAQTQSLALYTRLRDETGFGEPLVWAIKHARVIKLFGRYPHRNAILGRVSTPEEVAFLATPGSGF